jgi:hypothetical protein
MLRKSLALALVALACMGASPKPAARATKPAAAPAAPAHSGAIDARDPASLISILTSLGAQAQITRREGDAVFVAVTSPTENFSAQFAGCDAQGRACQALLFDRQGSQPGPPVGQLNAFNQTSVMCRLYQDKGGRPHVLYSALVFPGNGQAELLMHVNAWRGCIGDFEAFLKDPNGFLAGAA